MKARTIFIVATVILISHLAGLGIYIAYNASGLSSAREQHLADQIVTLTRLLENEPENHRAETARRISDHSLQLSIDDTPRVSDNDAQGEDTLALRHLLGFAIGASFNKNILADYREIAGKDLDEIILKDIPDRTILAQRVASFFRFREDLLVSVQFQNGQWLNVLVPGNSLANYFNPGLLPSIILMAVVTLFFIAWAMNRSLGVLLDFTRAAEALGMNPSRAEILPEKGPLEVRRTIHAFNLMQKRVQALVEERTRMVETMSQDFRTPLTRMRLRAEYIDNPREQKNMFEDIEDMESMISSTLDFLKDERSAEPRFRVELTSMLRELARDLGIGPVDMELHGVREVNYTCSPESMRRALTNLVNNALIYGQSAHISLELQPAEIIIYIDDEGQGIPETERDNVFLPFYRLEPSRCRNTGGTGLGLSISRSIIRAHGGDISLTRSPGGGNRVRVVLPMN